MHARVPSCPAEESTKVAGSVITGQQIGWQGLTRVIWASRTGCRFRPGSRVKISSDLVVTERVGAFAPAAGDPPPAANPATLRHLPWLKLRFAACDDATVRPIWMDLGQSVVVPAAGGSAAIVGPDTFFEVDAANAGIVVPPAGGEQTTVDATIWVRLEEVDCCEPYDVLLTDSALVPDSAAGSVDLIIPPRARCLTIHKDAGSSLGVAWVLDANLIVGTAGTSALASQDVLTVPEANRVRLTSGGPPQNVVLVWGLHL